MVTGASGVLGRAIVRMLAERDEVRATVRRPEAADELRAFGAKVAVREATEPDDLIEVLSRVHTLVHLIGGLNQPDADEIVRAIHGSTFAAVVAANEAGVRRLILLSIPGADPDAAHPFLRAKGLAEEAVVQSGLEYAVLRCAHAYGLGGLWFTATVVGAEHGFVVGDGGQRLAPLFADDVAATVAAIDDRRDRVEGTWHLEGPDVVSADDLFGLLGEGGRPEHLPPTAAVARLTALDVPVSQAAAELFASGTAARGPGVEDAAEVFGIVRTSLEEGLRITADRAARAR
jgi:uncharacterized protein YbjT (DUF2867 family)